MARKDHASAKFVVVARINSKNVNVTEDRLHHLLLVVTSSLEDNIIIV